MRDMLPDGSVDEGLTVNQIIRIYPETVEVFNRFGIDSCCGGTVPVHVAAVRDGLDAGAIWAALHEAIGSGR